MELVILPLAMTVVQPCWAASQAAWILAVMPPRPHLLLSPNLTSWCSSGEYVWIILHNPLISNTANEQERCPLHGQMMNNI